MMTTQGGGRPLAPSEIFDRLFTRFWPEHKGHEIKSRRPLIGQEVTLNCSCGTTLRATTNGLAVSQICTMDWLLENVAEQGSFPIEDGVMTSLNQPPGRGNLPSPQREPGFERLRRTTPLGHSRPLPQRVDLPETVNPISPEQRQHAGVPELPAIPRTRERRSRLTCPNDLPDLKTARLELVSVQHEFLCQVNQAMSSRHSLWRFDPLADETGWRDAVVRENGAIEGPCVLRFEDVGNAFLVISYDRNFDPPLIICGFLRPCPTLTEGKVPTIEELAAKLYEAQGNARRAIDEKYVARKWTDDISDDVRTVFRGTAAVLIQSYT